MDFGRHKNGHVFQRFGLFPHQNFLQKVGYGLGSQGIEENKENSVAMDKIQAVGLNGLKNQFPAQLSGGMQQRVWSC
jgi:ABC-type proline/glycine betaine transport system, ATPase component